MMIVYISTAIIKIKCVITIRFHTGRPSGIHQNRRPLLDKEILTIRCWHLPIFTPRRQGTFFGTTGLNFRVREKRSPKSPAFWRKDEWRSDTRADSKICSQWAKSARTRGGPLRHQQTVDSDIFWLPRLDLSCDNSVNSRVLYRLSYGGLCALSGDSFKFHGR